MKTERAAFRKGTSRSHGKTGGLTSPLAVAATRTDDAADPRKVRLVIFPMLPPLIQIYEDGVQIVTG